MFIGVFPKIFCKQQFWNAFSILLRKRRNVDFQRMPKNWPIWIKRNRKETSFKSILSKFAQKYLQRFYWINRHFFNVEEFSIFKKIEFFAVCFSEVNFWKKEIKILNCLMCPKLKHWLYRPSLRPYWQRLAERVWTYKNHSN